MAKRPRPRLAARSRSSRLRASSARKKDLGAIARSYGNVYVAQISMGANDLQTTKALLEADAWPGPSLVIAYSTCIAHGIDMSKSMTHQKDAVRSGYWPLYRFQPSEVGTASRSSSTRNRRRSRSLSSSPPRRDSRSSSRTHPDRAAHLAALAQADVDERWRYYTQLAAVQRTVPHAEIIEPEVESDAGYRYRVGGRPVTAISRTTLPRPGVAVTDRRVGRPAHG